MKKKFSQFLMENKNGVIYHVSPVKFTPGDKYGRGYDELYDTVHNFECDDGDRQCMAEYEILHKTLRVYDKGMGNVSGKNDTQIYVTSQPQAWIDVQTDELGITYKYGGIYVIIPKKPIKEHLVPAGMGYQLPEAIMNVSDIESYYGPFKTEREAKSHIK